MSERCAATVLQKDDRWGGVVDRCDLDEGHTGQHESARDACVPLAKLTWDGTYEGPQTTEAWETEGDE